MQLPVADVDRDHAGNAVLEQTVGEAAGGRADVDRVATVELDLEPLERVGELLAAAGDEARRPVDRKLGILRHLVTRLVEARHEPGEHERLSLRPALRQPTFDEQDVEALLHGGRVVAGCVTGPSWNCVEIASSCGRSRRPTSIGSSSSAPIRRSSAGGEG